MFQKVQGPIGSLERTLVIHSRLADARRNRKPSHDVIHRKVNLKPFGDITIDMLQYVSHQMAGGSCGLDVVKVKELYRVLLL